MTLLACTLLSLLPPQAYAGHYTVSYSGGNCNGQPYTFNNGVYGGGASANNQNPTVTCSGQITATFTWVPDPNIPNEPPPPAAVVMQNCTAQWQCNAPNAKSAQGSADNGLGFTPITLGNGTTQVGQSSSGVMYLIKTPAAGSDLSSFTVTCTPSANITIPVPFMGQAGVGITYSATATPLMVVLGGSGINLNTQPEYLIGQQVNCSLNPGGLTPSNYQWNPPAACQPFKDWQLSNYLNGDTSQPQSARFIPLAAADLIQSTLTFYPKVPTATNQSSTRVVVTCTVDLAVPAGAHPVGGFSGTAVTSLPFDTRAPQIPVPFILTADTNNNGYSVVSLNPPGFGVLDVHFQGQVITPDDFVKVRPDGTTDYGYYALCQLATPSIYRKDDSTPSNSYVLVNNGTTGLDNHFPFRPSLSADGLLPAQEIANDAPYVHFLANSTYYSVIENFHDWLMYLPPAPSCWVPLHDATWSWSAHATLENGNWLYGLGNVRIYPGTDYPAFPEWNLLWLNEKLNNFQKP